MASLHSASLLVMILLHVCPSVPAAPAPGPQPVVSRDSDELQKIHDLRTLASTQVSQLESENDESDLKNVVNSKNPREENAEAQEKDMRSVGAEDQEKFKATAKKLRAPPTYKTPPPPKPSVGSDDSIQVLAHALALIRQNEDGATDSDGERLGTSYNTAIKEKKSEEQVYQESEVDKQLEDTIARALLRLQQEDQGRPSTIHRKPEKSPFNSYHEEAIRIVEARLLRDITLANRLGLSVDDLIQDFEEKASREETLRKLENSLDSLAAGRDE
ncbi:hypothetical protein PoB_001431800 [Plakobranchus ocellatus]|uniref:Uncharacterized protein n=1 Tax=Plakobranchus ocellatus TaxID=259542 RepID=A0AAV3YZ59_9GAST|nr:hypothetical protein PoB_001431800 [Plakobranchus ocellatus]